MRRAPLLEVIEGQPTVLVTHLTQSERSGSAVTAVEIWHIRHGSANPTTVEIKITGRPVAEVRTAKERTRQRVTSVIESVTSVSPESGYESTQAGGTSMTASANVSQSLYDRADQSLQIGKKRIPRVFLSYSHDSEEHKKWVLKLANRLSSLAIWPLFDQWDVGLGGDLPRFMEQGVSESDRVLVICTSEYNRKANQGYGGAGYEKMIMTADLVRNQNLDRLIPVVRGTHRPTAPTFLSTRRYIDFTDDSNFDVRMNELSDSITSPGSQRPPFGV